MSMFSSEYKFDEENNANIPSPIIVTWIIHCISITNDKKQDLKGNTPDGLNELWKETKGFRTELQKTLVKRAELTLDAVSGNGVNTKPALRHYNPFSWEHN